MLELCHCPARRRHSTSCSVWIKSCPWPTACGACEQVTESARESPLQAGKAALAEQAAVLAYTARYFSGLPFQVATESLSSHSGCFVCLCFT